MYIPQDAIKSNSPHQIIALIGAPGSGKTTSALTFPERVWGDIDHKLPLNETAMPFWDAAWAVKVCRKHLDNDPPNYRDAIRKWLRENLVKFSPEQTYLHDSWSFHLSLAAQQIWLEDSRLDKPNKYFFWQQLLKYCEEISLFLKNAPCRVVVMFHETPERDEEGNLTGKLKPVQDGSFKDKVFGIYTDVYRVVHDPRIRVQDKGGAWKSEVLSGWYWQLMGDSICDCNTHPDLGPNVRKFGIKYIKVWIDPTSNEVKGGFNEILRIMKGEDLHVVNGVLQ